MKRIFCGIMVAILLLHCCMFALAEEEVLTIAVTSSSDARNLPAEEAFFKRYPDDDAQLIQNVDYLFGVANGIR